METTHLYILFDILTPVLLLICGYNFYKKTPEFGSEAGFRTWYSLASEKSWILTHKFSGRMFLISGGIIGVLCIVKYLVKAFLPDYGTPVSFALYFFEVASFISYFPVIKHRIRKEFGKAFMTKAKKSHLAALAEDKARLKRGK